MKILIAGAGKVGRAVTEELSSEGHDLTLIDRNADLLESIQGSYDVITIEGNAASATTLQEADIDKADLLIAATNADEINMLACITANAMNPNIDTIARIRDPEYVDQAYVMREQFGLKLVVNPEKDTAREIARLIRYPGFIKRETFAKAKVEIVELKVKEKSKLNNLRLMDLTKTVRSQVLVCCVLRDGKATMPDGNFILQEGDKVFVTGAAGDMRTLLLNLGIITKTVKHVLIAGGGKISYYLADELERYGITSSIIEQDKATCEDLARRLPFTTIVCGDASDQAILESEEIRDYDAFVSLTGLDELNIVTSMYASLAKVPHIVTKLGRGENFELTDKLPIGSIVCPKALCTMHIVRYVRAIQNHRGAAQSIHRIAEGKVDAIEFVVESNTRHIGEPLKDMNLKNNLLVVSIRNGSKVEIANGNSSFQIGDVIVVVTDKDNAVYTVNDIFEE